MLSLFPFNITQYDRRCLTFQKYILIKFIQVTIGVHFTYFLVLFITFNMKRYKDYEYLFNKESSYLCCHLKEV